MGSVLASVPLNLILQSSLPLLDLLLDMSLSSPLSLHHVSLYFSIRLSLQPVCELKRPRRNRTAGVELINLSLPDRPAINRSSSCPIHKHTHPSRPVDGFQKTPDAIIRTPPVKFVRCPSTSNFVVFQNTPGKFRGGVSKPSFQLRNVSKHPGHNRGWGGVR